MKDDLNTTRMVAPFTSKIDYLEKLKLHHLTVSEEILLQYQEEGDDGLTFNQRFIITVNGTVQWRAGSVSLGNRLAYITLSKARMKELEVDLGDTVTVALEKDRSKYGMEIPEEFEEVLLQDDYAKQRFESLTMGLQRAVIYIVAQLKSSQKRIDKSIFLLENLKKAPIGNETMRHILGKEIS